MTDKITAVAEDGTEYPNWDALLADQTCGFAVVAIIHDPKRKHPWPYVMGTFDTEAEAAKAKVRMRNRMKREQRALLSPYADLTFRLHIERIWKDPSIKA